jgi:2-polyprenyl-3-methyl-5-hydroxy-6-metoxy-1,4-benzoquinol methylase
MNEFRYVGSELELFAVVYNWKSYWSSQIQPFINGDVLEVGAGIGSNTPYLNRETNRRWVCLEPDPLLLNQLAMNVGKSNGSRECEIVCGTLRKLEASRFDTILYVDVLEHIENDREELASAASLLRVGGRVIVLAPAHQWLFTPFDAAIGHFRRYNRSMLRQISPAGLLLEKIWYLDSVGLALSAANRLFLRQSMPTKAQLRSWDQWVIPASRIVDKLSVGLLGKSIIGVWRRTKE